VLHLQLLKKTPQLIVAFTGWNRKLCRSLFRISVLH